jgi:hypothetical protein
MSNATTTQNRQRITERDLAECPVCGCDVYRSVETVMGGSVANSADTAQQRVCYEPIEGRGEHPSRVRVIFHRGGDLDTGHDDQAQLDEVMSHE